MACPDSEYKRLNTWLICVDNCVLCCSVNSTTSLLLVSSPSSAGNKPLPRKSIMYKRPCTWLNAGILNILQTDLFKCSFTAVIKNESFGTILDRMVVIVVNKLWTRLRTTEFAENTDNHSHCNFIWATCSHWAVYKLTTVDFHLLSFHLCHTNKKHEIQSERVETKHGQVLFPTASVLC